MGNQCCGGSGRRLSQGAPEVSHDDFWEDPFPRGTDLFRDPVKRKGSDGAPEDVYFDANEPRLEVPPTPGRARPRLEGTLDGCLPSLKSKPEVLERIHTLRSLRLLEGPLLLRAGYTSVRLTPAEYERRLANGNVTENCFTSTETGIHVLRGVGYAKTKTKITAPAECPYEFVCGDFFGTESRLENVARRVRLPRANGVPENVGGLPRFLIMHYLVPDYAATILGATDGPGRSLVFYFRLKRSFNPETFENQQALPLLRRFVEGGKEANGENTRDRMKFIARVMNLEKWGRDARLSGYQTSLMAKYNAKPVLTRPQHVFFRGPDYLEVSMNCHQWNYLGRKSLSGMRGRMHTMDCAHAFLVQGNTDDQLPEVILACARVTGLDMVNKPRPAPADLEEAGLMTPGDVAAKCRELSAESMDMARRGLRRKYWEDEEDLQANGKRKGRGRRGRNRDGHDAVPAWMRSTWASVNRPVKAMSKMMCVQGPDQRHSGMEGLMGAEGQGVGASPQPRRRSRAKAVNANGAGVHF